MRGLGVSCCVDRGMECGEASVAEWNPISSIPVSCTANLSVSPVMSPLSWDCRWQYLDKTLANASTTLQESIQAMVGFQGCGLY